MCQQLIVQVRARCRGFAACIWPNAAHAALSAAANWEALLHCTPYPPCPVSVTTYAAQ
jgi:hypothetical protein